MAFRGLFIGIDRYESPDIDELSCARRDAVALEALFADTLGGASVLLIDQDATRERIASEFAKLENCDSDDVAYPVDSGSLHNCPDERFGRHSRPMKTVVL